MGAAGGLGAARPDQHYEPPAGGQAIAGERAVVRARTVIVIGANGGVFVYNGGPPIAGRLIASIAAPTVTHDPPPDGNAVLAGITSYLPGSVSAFAVQILGEQIVFNSAASEAGPWTAQGTIQDQLWNEPTGSTITLAIAGGNQFTVQQAQIVANVLANLTAAATIAGGLTVTGGASITGGESVDQVIINGTGTAVPLIVGGAGLSHTTANLNGASNSSVLRVLNTQAAPNNPLVLVEGAAASDPALRIDVAADANARFAVDTTGLHKWGNGTNATDTHLYRAAAGELAADSIAANTASNTAEVWHAVGGTGNATFANSWANAASGPNLQYRLVAAPYNSIEWVGRIVAPAGVALNQAVTGSPAAPYKPNNVQEILGWDSTVNTIAIFHIGTGGALTFVNSLAPVGAGDTIVLIPALPSLDA